MGKALYRKYRSRSLDEIVGQEPIVTSLKNAINTSQLSHAYLFTGPRGTGKTSIARILAHQINEIPYESDELPLDIIEIDAASNRRIDEIRDLRDKVNIAPVSAKYKIYIIDEVHMLTREAFNALLKTLEEPPAHVIFILATTEFHKLPETIVSRTQRYNFTLATKQQVIDHLAIISKKENIKITPKALEIIANHSGGSLRDSLSILDQVRHASGEITDETVRLNLGLPSEQIVSSVYEAILSGSPKELITTVKESQSQGVSPEYLAEKLSDYLRQTLLNGDTKISVESSIKLMNSLLLVNESSRPEISLEISLIEIQLSLINTKVIDSRIETIQPPITINIPAVDFKPAIKDTIANVIEKEIPTPVKERDLEGTKKVVNIELWSTALEHIRQTHNTLYSVLRMAKLDDSSNDEKITLIFGFPFHQKRANEAKNRLVIAETLNKLGVNQCEIICETSTKQKVDKPKKESSLEPVGATQKTQNQSDDILIDHIKSVFGDAEVLE